MLDFRVMPAAPRFRVVRSPIVGGGLARYGREFMNVGRDGFIRQIARRLIVNTN